MRLPIISHQSLYLQKEWDYQQLISQRKTKSQILVIVNWCKTWNKKLMLHLATHVANSRWRIRLWKRTNKLVINKCIEQRKARSHWREIQLDIFDMLMLLASTVSNHHTHINVHASGHWLNFNQLPMKVWNLSNLYAL